MRLCWATGNKYFNTTCFKKTPGFFFFLNKNLDDGIGNTLI